MRFGADGLELRVGFWIADPENGRSNVLSAVNRAIWKVIREQGANLPFPQRVITLAQSPAELVRELGAKT
jgi:small-conductance mechanosensitive channel